MKLDFYFSINYVGVDVHWMKVYVIQSKNTSMMNVCVSERKQIIGFIVTKD